jgi:hypothetical protein
MSKRLEGTNVHIIPEYAVTFSCAYLLISFSKDSCIETDDLESINNGDLSVCEIDNESDDTTTIQKEVRGTGSSTVITF